MNAAPCATSKDQEDAKQAEFGRERHLGFRKHDHKFQQPPPLLFTQDHHPLWLGDIYRGRSAFLICGGPSFKELDHSNLRQPGFLTMGLNNSPKTFRPNLWCSVDSPDHWVRSIWLDPTIQKFVPLSHANKKIFNSDTWTHMNQRVGDCPNIVYYKRNEHFVAKQFLWEDCFNWGNHRDYGGGRSVMLPALRILFTLGVRRVYLLGCDLNMSDGSKYHFDQDRARGSIKGNNSTYEKLKQWFVELRPLFEEQNFFVHNCNPDSRLKAFPYVSFDQAVSDVRREMDNVDTAQERTFALYETETREKEEGVGKSTSWYRAEAPKGLERCRHCGKKCWKASGDKNKPGEVQLMAGCEQIRKRLWKAQNGRYAGQHTDITTAMGLPAQVVDEWNRRFGKEVKP